MGEYDTGVNKFTFCGGTFIVRRVAVRDLQMHRGRLRKLATMLGLRQKGGGFPEGPVAVLP